MPSPIAGELARLLDAIGDDLELLLAVEQVLDLLLVIQAIGVRRRAWPADQPTSSST